MKNHILLPLIIALFAIFSINCINAADGDTLTIKTIQFDGPATDSFQLPAAGERFEKIYMDYKIAYPYAEWDYLAYIYVNGIEIFRYITPYGNGMGFTDGFVWTIDVTDFAPYLHDKVEIKNVNSQEKVELTFHFIKGIPARDVKSIEQWWNFSKEYSSTFEDNLPPRKIWAEGANDKNARLKIIQTGHGFSNENPCAEFCEKWAYVYVNQEKKYQRTIWRTDCMLNPLYPQGGTWVYSRTNWCPGAEVRYYDYELTDYMNPKDSNEINYDMEYYDEPPSSFPARWDFNSFLIRYGEPNFKLDAAMVDILSPTTKQIYRRHNPVCNGPVIKIQNNGSTTLTSLKIKYGIDGTEGAVYNWSGNLKFLDTATIQLPVITFPETGNGNFVVELSEPNGGADEYAPNNKGVSQFEAPPVYYNNIVFAFRTNKYANEQYSYTLKDAEGNVIYSRDLGSMSDNTIYLDTFNLQDGCYELRFLNELGYGLDFFAVKEQMGSGWARLQKAENIFKTFTGDFGKEIYHQFRVGPKPEITSSVDTLDFGDMKINEEKELSVTIKPKNKAGLVISNAAITLGSVWGVSIKSTVPDISGGDVTLKEGESFIVNILMKPPKKGAANRSLIINSNDELTPSKTIKIIANVTDPNAVEDEITLEDMTLKSDKNPITGKSNISFAVNAVKPFSTNIAIYNSNGIKLNLLFNGTISNDLQSIEINAANYSSGMYYIVMECANQTKVLPIIIIK